MFEVFLDHQERVFQHLAMGNLTLKLSKCPFGYIQLKYLGHVVSKDEVMPDPKKIWAIKGFLVPATRKVVRRFMGSHGITIGSRISVRWLVHCHS